MRNFTVSHLALKGIDVDALFLLLIEKLSCFFETIVFLHIETLHQI